MRQPKDRSSRPLSALTPRAIEAFKLLIEEGRPMTARRIAQRMDLSQQNVYRLMRQLKQCGLIKSGTIIKQVFAARPSNYAYAAYVGWVRREFERLFSDSYRIAADKRK